MPIGTRGSRHPGRAGARIRPTYPRSPGAASWGTWAGARRATSYWGVFGGWSTGGTTRRASPPSRPGTGRTAPSRSTGRRGRSTTWSTWWGGATPGGPTARNAPPPRDASGRVAVVHNGIIENFAALRAELEDAGGELASDTDTEVAAHLVARALDEAAAAGEDTGLTAAVRRVVNRLEGAFTLVFTDAQRPDEIVAAGRSSPLLVGDGGGEALVALHVPPVIAPHPPDAIELGQDQIVTLTRAGAVVTGFHGSTAPTRPFHVNWDIAAAEKGGHDFFMLKEIEEQPAALADTLRGHLVDGRIVLDEQRLSDQELRDIDKVFVVACGTAYHAGLLAKYAIEHWCRIPVEVEVASEFRYRDPVLDRSTLVVAISQSGETADTLEAVRHAREQRARVLAICNTNGAQIPRESDAVLYTHAGPEVGVAATKTFT